MTSEEFNKKYKDYLEEGHYGLAFDVPTVTEYLDGAFTSLIKQYPNFKYSQIKLKFGMARFYCEPLEVNSSEIEYHINGLVKIYDRELEYKNLRNIDKFISKHCDENGCAKHSIHIHSVLQSLPVSTTNDIVELVSVIEKINYHNLMVYANTYFTKEEAQRHTDNLANLLSKSSSSSISLMRMGKGL